MIKMISFYTVSLNYVALLVRSPHAHDCEGEGSSPQSSKCNEVRIFIQWENTGTTCMGPGFLNILNI